MYEIFEQLLHKFKTTTYKVSKDTGISQTIFSNWKSGRSIPKQDKMQKIADYFGVSLEYLMTGEEKDDDSHYYLNKETREIAQEIFDNRDLRMLFYASRTAKSDDLKAVYDLLIHLKRKEKQEDI